MKIAHIINPFQASPSQDLYLAQPVTFESMRVAQRVAMLEGIEVELYAAYFAGDEDLVPPGFISTPPLERSVLDVVDEAFQIPKSFPLLQDILDRLYQATDADYLVYTNVDIALMPTFYITVAQKIEDGFDAFSITRRTISQTFSHPEQLPKMYAEIGKGHGGHDCFVFPRSHYPEYHLWDACIGAGFIGRALLFNMICNANNFYIFRKFHLTFHLGDERRGPNRDEYLKLNDYGQHNLEQVQKIIEHYRASDALARHKVIQRFIRASESMGSSLDWPMFQEKENSKKKNKKGKKQKQKNLKKKNRRRNKRGGVKINRRKMNRRERRGSAATTEATTEETT
jgi:hypothetical protein